MKSSRLLKVLSVLFVILMFLNALPMVEHLRSLIGIDGTTGAFQTAKTRKPSPPPFIVKPAAITVSGRQWGQSTCYIGASEGSSRYDIGDLLDLGINTYHIYGGMSRWEAHNDSSVYGTPTITQIKANPNIINWKWWNTAMTAPPDGSDYWWEPAPHWQGNARTLLSSLQANHIRIILVLRNRDDQHQPGWAPDPPKTTADWNEWWEHVFATVYWLNVRNHYKVTDFEIQNEPNIPQQGWAPEASEAEYFTFAQYTYDAINYVFHTYMPGHPFHVYAPATSGGNWPRDVLQTIPRFFDSMDIHAYGNMLKATENTHDWMNRAGYPGEPLWITEWGSYKNDYNSRPFGITLINNLIESSFPGNDYVYGSTIFSLYDFSINPTGLINYKGTRHADYYAIRMSIRALQGCRPTYQSVTSNKDLLSITTRDKDGNIYLLVTNRSSQYAYTTLANLSALRSNAFGTLWQFDSNHLDTITDNAFLKNGTATFTIPPNGAILVKLFHSRRLQQE